MNHVPPTAPATVNASLLWVLCPDEPGLPAAESADRQTGREASTRRLAGKRCHAPIVTAGATRQRQRGIAANDD
ncbi:hypothetical protein HOP61_11925 [Halomonas daqingensis]|uniref:Uncharacterized protein n=1 Tax=Billgrantia desiderata TaxID=52021 RepID=A0AAW4YVH6_9GAMM|nr:hypothetical protein [Halomonas desiderata]MCE8052006.1 hypothetical protein [Halomonas desiderata]